MSKGEKNVTLTTTKHQEVFTYHRQNFDTSISQRANTSNPKWWHSRP